jgi:hypothetical protein
MMYRKERTTSKLERVVFSRIIVAGALLTGYKVYGIEMAGTLIRLINGTGEANI